ncbi:MAG: DUF1540 domain-containing protein [Clostridiales bacterium]|nr:DUF1540 domain-containing protein [Clostridiales bacterium]
MSGQSINCNVNSCKYNDKATHCALSDIMVGSTNMSARTCADTECASFEA